MAVQRKDIRVAIERLYGGTGPNVGSLNAEKNFTVVGDDNFHNEVVQ
jgi:hypothetical protein